MNADEGSTANEHQSTLMGQWPGKCCCTIGVHWREFAVKTLTPMNAGEGPTANEHRSTLMGQWPGKMLLGQLASTRVNSRLKPRPDARRWADQPRMNTDQREWDNGLGNVVGTIGVH